MIFALLFGLTMALGILLFRARSAGKPSARLIRLFHRSLAVASVAAAIWKGGPLVGDCAILVGAVGFTSARIRAWNDTLATMLFIAHLVGAVTLLIIVALSVRYGFGPG